MISQKLASLEARIAKLEGKKAGRGLRPVPVSRINFEEPSLEDVGQMIQMLLKAQFTDWASNGHDKAMGVLFINAHPDEYMDLPPGAPFIEGERNPNLNVKIVLESGSPDNMSSSSPYGVEMDDYAYGQSGIETTAQITFKANGKSKTGLVVFQMGTKVKDVLKQMKPLLDFVHFNF